MLNLREYQNKAKSLPDLINFAFLVGEMPVFGKNLGIGFTKSGALLAAFEYAGPDMESSSPAELEGLSFQINHALNRLGDGWAVWIDMIRQPTTDYVSESECHFTDVASTLIDAERRAQYRSESAHFITRYVLTFCYTTPADVEQKITDSLVIGGSKSDSNLDEYIKVFATDVENAMSIIKAACDNKVKPYNSAELLTHIHGALTGDYHKLGVPRVPAFLDTVVGAHDLVGGFEPKIDDKEVRCVAIDGFPLESFPTILESMANLPIPMRWSIKFVFIDPVAAVKKLSDIRNKWYAKRKGIGGEIASAMSSGASSPTFQNQDAVNQAADADIAVSEASEGLVRFGSMTAVIVLFADDAKTVSERVKIIRSYINNLGFTTRLEKVNSLEAFMGSVPGQLAENIRRPLMNTMNLADFMPSTSIWAGDERNQNPFYAQTVTDAMGRQKKIYAPPLFYGATSGDTPFRFSLHVGDVGHTLIAGPTGAGKSTLLALIAAQHLRYKNSKVFAFDKGASIYPLTLATGGTYYEPGGENSTLYFAPLSRVHESDAERSWAASYIESLCVLQNMALTPQHTRAINDGLKALASSKSSRSMTDFLNFLQDRDLKAALTYYTMLGTADKILDAKTDSLKLSERITTIEVEHLMNLGNKIAVPVLLYLFRRIESMLDGSPSLIILDEAWALLDNPVFSAKIREWLKVLRKKNCAVIFATQSLADLQNNPLKPVLMESCPTKILLPNREAASSNLIGLYHDIGLNDYQVNFLRNSTPKSDYYIISPAGRRRISLSLGPVAQAFTCASGRQDLQRVKDLHEAYGDRWILEWLRERLPERTKSGESIRDGWVQYANELFYEFDEKRKLAV